MKERKEGWMELWNEGTNKQMSEQIDRWINGRRNENESERANKQTDR